MTESEISRYRLSNELMQRLEGVQQFTEIDSTNAEAMRMLQAGKKGSFLLLAHAQTAGRGRRGRIWQSPANAGIYLTLVRPFSRNMKGLQALSLVSALSVRDGLHGIGVPDIQLKWPNDLLVKKRKLAGILLELKQSQDFLYVILGVGINLSLPAEVREVIGRPVTDLEAILKTLPDRSIVVSQVVDALLNNIEEFENSGFAKFRSQWNSLDCYLEQDIILQIGEQQKIGRSKGVDENGALILATAKGEEYINGGEIFPSLSPASGAETAEGGQ